MTEFSARRAAVNTANPLSPILVNGRRIDDFHICAVPARIKYTHDVTAQNPADVL